MFRTLLVFTNNLKPHSQTHTRAYPHKHMRSGRTSDSKLRGPGFDPNRCTVLLRYINGFENKNQITKKKKKAKITGNPFISAFTCHEHGSPAIVYAPHHQLLISGGRKGEICIFDIRQRQMRHTFQASETPIRCLAMDPEEEYFVTGSAEGDIKVRLYIG